MGLQIAAVVAVPLLAAVFVGSTIDRALGSAPWGLLALIVVGLGAAGVGMTLVVRRFLADNPITPPADTAREAGRRWQREIDEEERRREAGEE
jgi:F0F1-type ATP synthase assembly protein I